MPGARPDACGSARALAQAEPDQRGTFQRRVIAVQREENERDGKRRESRRGGPRTTADEGHVAPSQQPPRPARRKAPPPPSRAGPAHRLVVKHPACSPKASSGVPNTIGPSTSPRRRPGARSAMQRGDGDVSRRMDQERLDRVRSARAGVAHAPAQPDQEGEGEADEVERAPVRTRSDGEDRRLSSA